MAQCSWHWENSVRSGRAITHNRHLSLTFQTLLKSTVLQEPSGFNATGEPIALNFATGEPDTRELRHPDGVILDIGTHVLAMLRETVRYTGGNDSMTLQVKSAKDRRGRNIIRGDLTTAEGEAHLQGLISGVPLDIWLNKYAGPAGGQKVCAFICVMGVSSATTDGVPTMCSN